MLWLGIGLLWAGIALADRPGPQGDVHQHGHIALNVALQGDLLSVALEAPAVNVLGFEREPRTDAERRRWQEQLAWLESGRQVLGVPAAAGCRLEAAQVSAPTWRGRGHSPDHDHDDNDAAHSAADGVEHADFSVQWRFRCRNPRALLWFEPWLRSKLPDVERLVVRIVTERTQTEVRAAAATQRIALR
ncbi:MAG: DUF2796 domain-containing protein [Steroidobacteraceae bacterium]|nr:DUF2796 domain-containing protein [Steroidobacteraceae bacterium]MDW8258434.1 DUF2796 domain-containing protein [Gammaproteobacteria bacterium]